MYAAINKHMTVNQSSAYNIESITELCCCLFEQNCTSFFTNKRLAVTYIADQNGPDADITRGYMPPDYLYKVLTLW